MIAVLHPADAESRIRELEAENGRLRNILAGYCGQRKPLTPKQHAVFQFIDAYIREHGYSPAIEEMAVAMHYQSSATIHEHLTHLQHKGWIRRAKGAGRGITIIEAPQ
jgi:repressor LexA